LLRRLDVLRCTGFQVEAMNIFDLTGEGLHDHLVLLHFSFAVKLW